MAHVNCPNCKTRLRAPDTDQALMLRCPACKYTFRSSGEASAAPDNGQNAEIDQIDVEEEMARKFSEADELMLREFGSGSGLLELTRETYNGGLDVTGAGAQAGAGAETTGEPGAAADVSQRQFQIVATALSLANKLVITHKTDAIRTRKNARLAWMIVAVLGVLVAASLWHGAWRTGSANVERANATKQFELEQAKAAGIAQRLTDAETRLAEEKSRSEKLSQSLQDVRGELRTAQGKLETAQGELAAVREAVGQATARQEALTNDLKDAKDTIAKLSAELDRAKAAAEAAPTTQPASVSAAKP